MVSLLGHARLIVEYTTTPPRNPGREILAKLDKRGIRFGEADYWLAYQLTFLAGERIILAATEVPRILTYEPIVKAHSSEAVLVSRRPCAGSEPLVEGVSSLNELRRLSKSLNPRVRTLSEP